VRILLGVPLHARMPDVEAIEIASTLGIPNYRPNGFHPAFAISLNDLKKTGHEVFIRTVMGAPVDAARCTLFGIWLDLWRKGDRYDYFWMIDSDISFTSTCLDSMIAAGKPIIGAGATYKADSGIKAGLSVSRLYPREKPDKNGILKVRWLNGACTLLRADGLFRMMATMPELRYQRFPQYECDNVNIGESWAFWTSTVHTFKDTKETIFISEDYAFSQRAMDCGIDNYLDLKVKLSHWNGTKEYQVKLAGDINDGKAKAKEWDEIKRLSAYSTELHRITYPEDIVERLKGLSTKIRDEQTRKLKTG